MTFAADIVYLVTSHILTVVADLVYIATKAAKVNLFPSTLHPNYAYYVLRMS